MTESEQLAEIKELIETKLDHLEAKTDDINQRLKEFDIRIETYQKSSQQVVNLAFSLIIATAPAIVIPAVFAR
ncbi:hypothetical protein [Crocosphaera sp.]|uniref:hypothetical protein n=1 Tax=Crocosphaera sp. TaxID=2729996 RepID=UPI003F293297|nr:hypothetical protein [Crocosphaera sp.]